MQPIIDWRFAAKRLVGFLHHANSVIGGSDILGRGMVTTSIDEAAEALAHCGGTSVTIFHV